MSTPTARQQTIRINRLSKENDMLSKELEHVKNQLKWARITSSQETELKNSCFFFIAAKGAIHRMARVARQEDNREVDGRDQEDYKIALPYSRIKILKAPVSTGEYIVHFKFK